MDNKNNKHIQKVIIYVLVVALLFTSGFILGALTAKFREYTPVIAPTPEITATAAPVTTETPTTAPAVITTTAAPSTEPTTQENTTSTTAPTTQVAAEEDEPCCIIRCLLKILEFLRQVIDFIISVLSSL